jgi:hypothetical protein
LSAVATRNPPIALAAIPQNENGLALRQATGPRTRKILKMDWSLTQDAPQANGAPLNMFRALYDAGYRRLVPIVIPNARLSPNSTLAKRMANNKAQDARGKAPGIRGDDGLWRGFDWLKHETTEADLDRWASWGAGVGIRTGCGLVAVDIDTLAPECAAACESAATDLLGPAPVRIGNAPKRLLLYRTAEEPPYQRILFDDGTKFEPGKDPRVELLSEGRQFVAAGIHPKTGKPYEWQPHIYFAQTLTPVTAQQLKAYFAHLATILPAGRTHIEAVTAERANVDQRQLLGDLKVVTAAVAALPNTSQLFPSYEDYIRVGYAIKGATQDDTGLELFQQWAAKWAGGNDPDTVAADWARMKPPYSVGAQYLYELARRHGGFQPAEAWFTGAPAAAGAAVASAGGEDWPEPLDIFGDGDPTTLMEVPAGALPDVLDRYARDTAARMGVPVAFAALGAVVVSSAAIGGTIRIQPKALDTGWTQPPFLWGLLVENPGGRKSPLMSAVASPLEKLDARRAKEDLPKLQEWERANRKRGKDAPPVTAKPRLRRGSVDSFTVEGLREVLADNPKGVLVSADEITGLIGGLDQYKSGGGSDRADLLKLMDGQPRVFDRVGRSHRVECWGAAVLGGIQPKKLSEMAPSLDPDGLLQRFIPIVGDNVRRRDVDRMPDREAMRAYEDLLAELAELPEPGFFHCDLVKLSDGAQEVRRRFDERVLTLLEMPNVSAAWCGHLNKWPGFFARMLLVFHMVENWRGKGWSTTETPVSAETAEKAWSFASFLLVHAVRFYESIVGLGASGDAARRAAGILLVEGTPTVTRRAIAERHRPWRAGEGAHRELIEAMTVLGRMGWCRPGDWDKNGVKEWVVNPAVYVRFKDRAAAEEERRKREYQRVLASVAERRALVSGVLS